MRYPDGLPWSPHSHVISFEVPYTGLCYFGLEVIHRHRTAVEIPSSNIMDLIDRAPWQEAVTYRETWPHEYVVIQKYGQQELLAAFCRRILRGEGVEGRFFHQSRQYLFLGDYKY